MKHFALILTGILQLVTAGSVSAAPAVSDFFQIRDGVQNSQYFFANDRVGNQYLFFLGNSVLAGKGLKNANLRYSAQMKNAFKKHFPNASPRETRHMQPGGSWFGMYRSARGQAVFGAVISSGHLAILDFAADDRTVDIEQAKLSVEAIVREVIAYRATHSQILVYTLTPEILAAYKAGKTPEYIRVSEAIAAHYGIPSLNLAKYAAAKIMSGEISFEEFSSDGINPTDAGAKIYAAATTQFVDGLMTAYPVPTKPVRHKMPDPLFPKTNDQARIVAYEHAAVKTSGQWRSGQESPIGPFRHLLVSDQVGDSVRLRFRGSEIGLIDVADKNTAVLEYSIDGHKFAKLPRLPNVSKPTMRPISLADDLDRNIEHELVLRVASPGVARIGGFLVNGTIEDPFAGMDALQQIDAIYAAMDPITYDPPADRFKHIPKTMAKLREGGDLRMVLLGDSIMGNTSGSRFELLLKRAYPKCNLVKIASLRSSTGCTYYQEDDRIEKYVLRHKPDLLVIGGISNRGDYEAGALRDSPSPSETA